MGFYFGFKLQLITNIDGIPIDLQFTSTKIGDRNWLESRITRYFTNLSCFFVVDKGYQGIDFTNRIFKTGNYILTGVKSSKSVKLPLANWQMGLLKLRARIENCFGKLKNEFNLITTKARSEKGFMNNLILAIFSFVVGWKWFR